ncbi:hypothetical protein PIB30_108524 [Stylosanthes scabra]|uniref:Uncharacterized protein n=1 Tax=Stylosanthes scabra TaxID=79078 RepID=A0ABU6VY35_9FABA|nr:hypothetical protein [Stylosanthes scabra]
MHGGSVIHAYAWKTLWQRTQDPRIGVKVHAYAWKAHSSHMPGSVIHAYAWKTRESPRICVESSFQSRITPSPALNILNVTHPLHPLTQPSLTTLRICVGTIFALNITSPHAPNKLQT